MRKYAPIILYQLQVTLPGCSLSRYGHSIAAIKLCPGLEQVNIFGGSSDDFDDERPIKDDPRIAETNLLTFGE